MLLGATAQRAAAGHDVSAHVLQVALFTDAVLSAQLLPELRADLVAALADLDAHNLSRHGAVILSACRQIQKFI